MTVPVCVHNGFAVLLHSSAYKNCRQARLPFILLMVSSVYEIEIYSANGCFVSRKRLLTRFIKLASGGLLLCNNNLAHCSNIVYFVCTGTRVYIERFRGRTMWQKKAHLHQVRHWEQCICEVQVLDWTMAHR